METSTAEAEAGEEPAVAEGAVAVVEAVAEEEAVVEGAEAVEVEEGAVVEEEAEEPQAAGESGAASRATATAPVRSRQWAGSGPTSARSRPGLLRRLAKWRRRHRGRARSCRARAER